MRNHRRVVITGLGTVSPCGLNVADTWESMIQGRSGISRVTRFDAEGLRSQCAGEVNGFDGEALLGRREARRLGLFMQYAAVAADEGLADAGFDRAKRWPDSERFGIFVGSGIGGLPTIYESAIAVHEEGIRALSPFFIPRSLINLATGNLAIRYSAAAPSMCAATACAVGNHSIGEAFRCILDDDADVVVAGGSEAALSPLGYGGFMVMKAMSKRNDDPATASRPFDKERDGFVMSEGAGIVILEELQHALARGARIYCELAGYGSTTDAHHITAPSPGGRGAARCMQRALKKAGVEPEAVDYINAHGTSTQANDAAETSAIRAVFGDHADKLAVSSTKSVTGHLLGAAGGLEAVASAMAIYTGIIPPTANYQTPDPACDLDYVVEGARESRPAVVLSNGFGFGGTNASLVFKAWRDD